MFQRFEKKEHLQEVSATVSLTDSGEKAIQLEGSSSAGRVETPLLQLDLRFDTLQGYLENVTKVVNQHAEMINHLKVDVKKKAYQRAITSYWLNLGKAIPEELVGSASMTHLAEISEARDEESKSSAAQKHLSEKVEALSRVIVSHSSRIEEQNRTIELLQDVLKEKVDREEYQNKIKTTKQSLKNDMEDLETRLERRLIQVDRELREKISAFEDEVKQVEQRTCWKIKDCEDLLKERPNHQYISDAIKALEVRLKKGVVDDMDDHRRQLETLQNKMMEIIRKSERTIADKVAKMKDSMRKFDDALNGKCDRFRADELMEKLQNLTEKHESETLRLSGEIDRLEKELEKITQERLSFIASPKKSTTSQEGSEITKLLTKSIRALETRQSKLEADMKACLKSVDSKIDTFTFKAELSKKADREDLKELEIGDFEELSRKIREELNSFTAMLTSQALNMDKKFVQMRKDFDTSALKRLIESKADVEETEERFGQEEQKLKETEHSTIRNRKDLENLHQAIKKILVFLKSTQTEHSNALVANKTLYPQNCLSCGRGDARYPPGSLNVKGRDGKMYKAEPVKGRPFGVSQITKSYEFGLDIFGRDGANSSAVDFSPTTGEETMASSDGFRGFRGNDVNFNAYEQGMKGSLTSVVSTGSATHRSKRPKNEVILSKSPSATSFSGHRGLRPQSAKRQ